MDEKEETQEPLSLMEFVCKSMVKSAEKHELAWDSKKIPPSMGEQIWKHCKVMDIITLAANTNQLDWFAQNVTKPPSNLMALMRPKNRSFPDIFSLQFDYNDNGSLYWLCNPYTDPNEMKEDDNVNEIFQLNIGTESLPTLLGCQCTDQFFDSACPYGINYRRMLKWICTLFRCDIDCLELNGKMIYYEYYIDCQFVINAKKLTITDCDSLEFLLFVIQGRQRDDLKTKLVNCQTSVPIPFDLLQHIENDLNFFDMTNYTLEKLIEFAKTVTKDFHRATTTELTAEDIELFKEQLNLSDCEEALRSEYGPACYDVHNPPTTSYKLFYSVLEGDKARSFQFYEKEPGVYNQLLITIWAKDEKESYDRYMVEIGSSWLDRKTPDEPDDSDSSSESDESESPGRPERCWSPILSNISMRSERSLSPRGLKRLHSPDQSDGSYSPRGSDIDPNELIDRENRMSPHSSDEFDAY